MTDQEVETYFEKGRAPSIEYLSFDQKMVRYLWKNNGKRTTVIFVHGAPGSSSAFIDFFIDDRLNETFNLISVDRLGYGFSEFGNPAVLLEEQAEVIQSIVDQRKLKHTFLLGHSLGVPIIAQAVVKEPEDYHGLLLVAGSVDPKLEPGEWYRPWLRNRLMQWLLPATLYTTNEEIYHLKDQLEVLEPQWQTLDLPVIIVQGEADRLVPKENAQFLMERIPAAQVELWLEPGVNHFIPWNRPDLIVNALLKLEGK